MGHVPTAPPKAPSTPSGSGGFRRRHNTASPADVPGAPSAPRCMTPTAGAPHSPEIDWKAVLGPAPTVAALDLRGRFESSSWGGASAMAMDLGGDTAPSA